MSFSLTVENAIFHNLKIVENAEMDYESLFPKCRKFTIQ